MSVKYILSIVLLCASFFAEANDSAKNEFAEANKLNIDASYTEAINKYEAMLNAGNESDVLYYNLGYAYYKSGQLAKAILNLERAKRLNPGDQDINYNLEVAYSQTVDKIDSIRPVFFVRWWHQLINVASSDVWGNLFVIFLFVFLASLLAFLFAESMLKRKVGFFVSLVAVLFAASSLYFSIFQRDKIVNSTSAIIFADTVTVTTSPDDNGTEMVVLHEGTKVDIVSKLGDWCEIRLSDGNVGWLKNVNIQVI